MFLGISDRAVSVIGGALEKANLPKSRVGFFACHQSTSWLGKVIQQQAGLQHSQTLDTFDWAASIGSANIPLVLKKASESNVLKNGDIVVAYTGGTGITDCATVLRWAM